jgi:hypothetical protein
MRPAETWRDYRDLALADAAHDHVLAHERITSLEQDLAVAHEIIVASFDALQELTRRHRRQCAEYDELNNAYQRLREECLFAADAAV